MLHVYASGFAGTSYHSALSWRAGDPPPTASSSWLKSMVGAQL